MEFVTLGFAVYYVTMVLTFDYEDIGPFPSSRTFIHYNAEGVLGRKPVDLFDRFRYIFGAYRRETNGEGISVWFVRPHAMLVWSCPACLAFWVSCAVSALVFFLPYQLPLVHVLALAGVTRFLGVWRG